MDQIDLIKTTKNDWLLLERMAQHYSSPKGFVGRNICYAIFYDQVYYGHIVGGSATRFLPGRNEYFGIDISEINGVINNTFYSVSKAVGSKYPIRNFTSRIVGRFCEVISYDWYRKYGDPVIGFEFMRRIIVESDPDVVIHGAYRGADLLAKSIAKELGIPDDPYPADWSNGSSGGPIRNQRMLDDGKPDVVVAFFDGKRSGGTLDMVNKAHKAGVPVREYGCIQTTLF